MPRGLRRFQESQQSHFITFSCHRRQPLFAAAETYDLFVSCLEVMRRRFDLNVYGYVVMPEHVHLLLSEPAEGKLSDAIHFLKLSFAKRVRSPAHAGGFWQKRYYDRNVRNYREFTTKLRYLHRNPVKRRLVESPEEWKWSSYRHYALREKGVVEIESEWTARDREAGIPRVFLFPG
jgi:putative transposase